MLKIQKENKVKVSMEKHQLNQTNRINFTEKKTQIVNEKEQFNSEREN